MSRAFSFGSIGEFNKFLKAEILARNLPMAREAALKAACEMTVAEAKGVIGTYKFDWPQLAEATQDERERLGFARNEPLLRTGELRDSISYTIDIPGVEATVGSTSDVGFWQELGTETIPPRPFLLPSFFYLKKPIKQMIGDVMMAALGPKKLEAEIAHIIMHFLKDVAREVREALPDDDEQKRQ